MDEAAKPAKKAPRRDFEGMIDKAVQDNFKNWDASDIHGSKDPDTGMTLYETIAHRKRKNTQDAKAYPMGSLVGTRRSDTSSCPTRTPRRSSKP